MSRDLELFGWLGVGILFDQWVKWDNYKDAVGVENTSFEGFRIWKEQTKIVTGRQPHLQKTGMWITGLGWIALAYAWLDALGSGGSNAGLIGWLLVFVFIGWLVCKHRPRTRRWKQEQAQVNAWHKSGRPQGQAPGVCRVR